MKKFISVLSSICLILQVLPAIAAVGQVDIATAGDFLSFAQRVREGETDLNAVLTADIELDEETVEPIPTYDGVFDGGDHRLSGFNIASNGDAALFATLNGTVKGLVAEGRISGKNAAAIAVNNNGVIQNVLNRATVYATDSAAGIAANNAGRIISCVNAGDVSVSSSGVYAGGIAGYSGCELRGCVNYGSVTAAGGVEDVGTGGIAGTLNGKAYASMNYGPVTGVKNTGGIAGMVYGDIDGSENYGTITGDSNVGGIAGLASGTVSSGSNHGEIHAGSKRAGGIVGNLEDGGIELCYNAGAVSGTETDKDGNFTGGILGYTLSDSVILSDVYNEITVKGEGAVGEIAGRISGTVKAAFSLDKAEHSNCGGGKSGATLTAADYSRKNNWSDDIELFKTLAGSLNTLDGTVADRGIWVDDEFRGYPIFVKDSGDNTDTANELIEKLGDPKVREIALSAVIEMPGSASVIGEKTIKGGQIIFDEGGFVIDGAKLTLSNTSIRTSADSIKMYGEGTVAVSGYLDVNAPVDMTGGVLDLTGGSILNKRETELIPSFITDGATEIRGGERCVQTDDGWFYCLPSSYFTTQSLVVPAAENGLPYDIYSSTINDIVYLFLPAAADLSSLTFKEVSGGGEILTAHEGVDFTDPSKTVTVTVGGFERQVKAMRSSIPALYLSINEDYGSIEAMNTSPDHSVKCYGDLMLDVPAELQEKYGWESFVSVENDEKKKGTMEIKGRGNSTWKPDLTSKKPYQIKLEKKTDVLGMGKAKTWLIIKNDEYIIRNKLALDLGREMGMTFTGGGEFVDVYMNGEFLGNYLLTEKVEIGETRVNISNLDDEYELNNNSIDGLDMTGGYLVEVDNWGGDDLQVQKYGTTFSIKEPEDLAKTVTDDDEYAYIKHYLEDFLDAVFGDGRLSDGSSYMGKIDTDSIAAYFWNQEFLRNRDCGHGSTYFYKDKDSIDPLLYAGPLWDNDMIFISGGIDDNVNGWLNPTLKIVSTGTDTIYNKLIHRREFAQLVIRYYEDHNLKDIFARIHEKIPEYSAYLEKSAEMNAIRWGLNKFNISRFDEILQKRAAWVDENLYTLLDVAKDDQSPLSAYFYDGKLMTTVYNAGESALNAKLVIAAYGDDGSFIGAETTDISLEAGACGDELASAIPDGAARLNVMLLNSMNDITPLAESLSLSCKGMKK